jgi:phage tail-like protein
MEWYIESMEGKIMRRAVIITLLSSLHAPVMVLQISGAFPVKWEGPQLRSDDTSVAVQSLELACGSVVLVPHAGGFTQ